MPRPLALTFGVLLSLLALAVVFFSVFFVRFFDTTYPVNAQTVTAGAFAVALALVASGATALSGLRLIAPQRWALPRLRHLGALSGVSMGSTLGLFAWTVYVTANRPIHGAAALAAVGKPFDLTFTAIDGRKIDVAEMKGKVVLINFWAVWCGPCVAEMPHLKRLYDRWHPHGFEIIGVSLDRKKSDLENFVRQQALPWPQYFDGLEWKNVIAQRFGIHLVPQNYLIDKKGRLRDIDGWDDLSKKVAELNAE